MQILIQQVWSGVRDSVCLANDANTTVSGMILGVVGIHSMFYRKSNGF